MSALETQLEIGKRLGMRAHALNERVDEFLGRPTGRAVAEAHLSEQDDQFACTVQPQLVFSAAVEHEQTIQVEHAERVVVEAGGEVVAFLFETTRAVARGRQDVVDGVVRVPQIDVVKSSEQRMQVAFGVGVGDEAFVEVLALKHVGGERAQLQHASGHEAHETLEIRLAHLDAEQAQTGEVREIAEVAQIQLNGLETGRAEHVGVDAQFERRVRLFDVFLKHLSNIDDSRLFFIDDLSLFYCSIL